MKMNRLFNLFQQMGSAVLVFDVQTGRILFANQKYCHFYGWSEAQLHSMTIFDLDTRPVEQVRAQVGRMEAFFALHRLADGGTRMVRLELGRETLGGADVVIATIIDQTAQKLAEVSLGESEEKNIRLETRLNNIIEGSGLGTWEWNVQTGEAIYNPRWAEIIGYTLEELAPLDIHTWERLVHPDDLKLSQALTNAVLQHESPHYEMQCRLRHKNGGWVWVQDQGNVTEWLPDGRPLWMAGTHADISARKQFEESLQASEERFRQLASYIEEVFWLFDVSLHKIVYISPAYEKIWGKTCESLYVNSLDYIESILPEDKVVLFEGLEKQSRGERVEMEYRILRPDGNIRWIFDRSFPVFDGEGRLVRQAGIASDITEVKNARYALQQLNAGLEGRVLERTQALDLAVAELQRALNARDEFLSAISHELRTPLTGILGLSQVLLMPSYGVLTEKQTKAVENINLSGQRLLNVINDVIEYSMIQSGRVLLVPEVCSLEAICRVTMRKVAPLAEKKNQRMVMDISSAPASLFVDERRLDQVLQQLLKNASKFTPVGGEFGLIATDAGQNKVEITIWDRGIGIKQEDLPRLFLPFVQLDASLSRQYEGTGLGLALAARLVELLGGKIVAESTFGEGSRFRLTLPGVLAG